MRTPFSHQASTLAAALAAFAACSSSDDGGTGPAERRLSTVSGTPQEGFVGAALTDPLVVRVAEGQTPISGVGIEWQITSGGGSVSPATSTTDADGTAQTSFTLGGSAGMHTATATAAGIAGSPQTFTAQAFLGQMAIADGSGQNGLVGNALQNPLRVLLTSGAGAGLPDVTVNWSVVSGSGSVAPTSSQTDASGFASTTFTLGSTPGSQAATASASGYLGSPVTFSATAVAQNAAVNVDDNFFSSDDVTIATDGTVTWTWVGSDGHNVTFDAGPPNSVTQSSGDFNRTFPSAGTFNYVCTIHVDCCGMRGVVNVVAVP